MPAKTSEISVGSLMMKGLATEGIPATGYYYHFEWDLMKPRFPAGLQIATRDIWRSHLAICAIWQSPAM
jgi:hypothetical protein